VPDIIVLGGGVMDAYDLFAPTIHQIVKRNTMVQSDRVSIRKAVLGNDAGIIGAARIALDMRE
jgi:glucokinase